MSGLTQLLGLAVLLLGLALPAQPRRPGLWLGYRLQSLALALLLLAQGIGGGAPGSLLAAAIVLAGQCLLLPALLRHAPQPAPAPRQPSLLVLGAAAAILGIAVGGGFGLALGTMLAGLAALLAGRAGLSRLAGLLSAWNGALLAAAAAPGLPFLPALCGAGVALLAAAGLRLLHEPAAPEGLS